MTPSEFLDLSDERELWHRRISDAWRAGMAHGEAIHDQDYERGYAAAIAEIKQADQGLFRAFKAQQILWVVRGQQRTRLTFGHPHHRDFAP